ncbi:MAG: phosphatidylglycerophosphatase A family protein [Geminicoccaceae bacterium]
MKHRARWEPVDGVIPLMTETEGKPGQQAPRSDRWLGIARWLATWFGVGHLPKAPGTFGSIAALPLAWLLVWLGGPWLLLLASVLVFGLGLWAAGRYADQIGRKDPGSIVVDEVVGQWLTLLPAPLDPLAYGLGLIAFRLFDILKPWPIHLFDRHVTGGLGVMIDDVVAAIYAGGLLYLAVFFI